MKYLPLITLFITECTINPNLNRNRNRKEFKYKDVSICIMLNEKRPQNDTLEDNLKKLERIKSSIDDQKNNSNQKIIYASSEKIYNALINKAEEIFII